MTDINMEAAIVFDSHIPTALRRALEYAGEDGYVASMPQLLHARANASYDNIIWNTWFTSNSEESVVTTAQGTKVIVAVNGGGIFSTPERFEQLYRSSANISSREGFTGQHAAKISDKEARDILEGRLADGTEIPIYMYDDFKGMAIADLPIRYGVIMEFEIARKSTRGYDPFEVLKEDINFVCHAGGLEAAAIYLDKARDRHNTSIMGNWHPYNRIDSNQPQTRIPFLAGNQGGVNTEDNDEWDYGYDAEYGLGGDACTHNMARYIAIAPQNVATSLRDLNFETAS